MLIHTDQKNIKAVVGQTVTLPCQAPKNDKSIIAAEWSRADLGDKYLLLYWNEKFDPTKQHPSFKNWVDLQDRQMKDGDVSLILKEVTTTDSGTYECRVVQRGTNMDDETVSTIYLRVVAPGQTRRRREAVSDGVIIGQGVYIAAVFVIGLFIFYICYKRMNHRIN
ncbi:butyrophilin-like protein 9 [Astatotilapia calliptera]|uniref:butyrophilin-like protein 9 n=1 Tax=Astatotilapia calliptera TaxID=8154 RepID=UPI000E409EA6|nr:butyrophilin-like protein 9 [Astatotilapia calliptera]